MKKLLLVTGMLLVSALSSAQQITKISALPAQSAASTGATDIFPFVNMTTGTTKKMTLWDILNLPPLAAPTFPGPVAISNLTNNEPVLTNGSNQLVSGLIPVATDLSGTTQFSLQVGNVLGGINSIALPILTNTMLQGLTSGNPLWTTQPSLGANGQSTGSITFFSSLGGSVTLRYPGQIAAGGAHFDLPIADGSNGNVLMWPSSGTQLAWTAPFTNPMTTGGDIIYGGASGVATRLPNGSSGQVLQSQGTTVAPQWATLTPAFTGLTADGFMYASNTTTIASTAQCSSGQVPMGNGASAPTCATVPGNATILHAPTVQNFSSTGTIAGYMFTVSSSTVGAACVFSNGGHNYTVINAISSGVQLWASGASGATLTASTLTYVSGGAGCNGASNLSYSSAVAYATYTAPSGPAPLYVRVKIVGGGGAGFPSGTGGGTAGKSGTLSAFGANNILANPGNSGGVGSGVASGGSASIGSAIGVAFSGADSPTNMAYDATLQPVIIGGGPGAASALGGGASGANAGANAGSGATIFGAGGGGGGCGATNSCFPGPGGSAGGYVDAIIAAPAATYPYIVGVGGTDTSGGGTSGAAGGAGGNGYLWIEEFYQ